MDEDGVNFFFNTVDGTSTWDHPLDFYFRNMLRESLAAPKTVHSDAGNAGCDMSLADVAAAGCDIIALSTQQGGDAAAVRSAGIKRGVETSAGQVMTYARHLGMNLTRDLDLLWIAEQALNAPTPAGWKEHTTEDGTVYYSNQETGLKTYAHPLDDHFRELYRRSREVKLLSSKEARMKTSSAGAKQKPPHENRAIKVIESLNVIEGAVDEEHIREDLETRRRNEVKREEEEKKKKRSFGTDLTPSAVSSASNVAANQPAAAVVAVAEKKDALDRRERCVIPAASKKRDEKFGPFGLPEDAEGVGFKDRTAAAAARGVEKESEGLTHLEKCVDPAAATGSPELSETKDGKEKREEKGFEVDVEAEELAEAMRLSAEEADRARLRREAEEKAEAEATAEALKLSAELAEAMKVSAAHADEERVQREAEAAAEAEIIKLSLDEAEAKRQRDAFAFDEEQRAIARAAIESVIAEKKTEAARRAEEEKLEAERAEKARIAAEEAERARVAAERENVARLAVEAEEAALEAEAMKLSAEEAQRVRAALEAEAAQEAQAIKLSLEEAEARRRREVFAFDEYQTAMAKALQASAVAEQKAEAARKAEENRLKAEAAERARVAAEEVEKVRAAAAEADKGRVAAKANEARRARRALEVAEAVAEAEAIRLSIAEAKVRAKLYEEEQKALTRATTASLAERKAANDEKAKELVPSLLFAGLTTG